MTPWLDAALSYVPQWIGFQMTHAGQPGAVIAVAKDGEIVLEQAFGAADLATGEPLTTRHRFRVASHSKTFTACGILKLREQGRLKLDDKAGAFVEGLHPEVADVTIAQLLSHSSGLVRDGVDAGQFSNRRPFLSAEELREGLSHAPPLQPNTRFKYSNHGFGLLGLIIEAATSEPYEVWIAREVVAAAGLKDTYPDAVGMQGKLASGHGTLAPLGRRAVIPGDNPTRQMASATGFVSTPADLARFFAQLSPKAGQSLLSPATRRDMARRHWRDEAAADIGYGLGTINGVLQGAPWFGHSGSFQGTLSRTAVFAEEGFTISVAANAIDGPAQTFVDGIAIILKSFSAHGAPTPQAAVWAGRWWSLWGATDLVPMGDGVRVNPPALPVPFAERHEIAMTGLDEGIVTHAPGFRSPGEPARLVRGADGAITEVRIGGGCLVSEARMAEELRRDYSLG